MKKILVIGHGQLGLMMAAESARLGMHVDRLDLVSGEIIGGTSSLRQTLPIEEIICTYDTISCELEHLPDHPVVNALVQSDKWVNRRALDILPNRHTQKRFIDSLSLPTAPWLFLQSADDIAAAHVGMGESLIVKTTRGGYDGKGQWRIEKDTPSELPKEIFGNAIIEKKIPFKREVSIIGVRNAHGATDLLPLAENVHHEGILRLTRANHIFDAELIAQGFSIIGKIMDALNYEGVMAVECFDTEDGLLINEIAPRVHNSGHWSQIGARYNQFYLHLLALQGLPPPPNAYIETVMLNLIGCQFNPDWLYIDGVDVHWYGKDVRPLRKVGHLNFAAENQTAIQPLIESVDEDHRAFLADAFEQ